MYKSVKCFCARAVCFGLAAAAHLGAQAPVVTINAQQHGDLAGAQQHIVEAYEQVSLAQQANGSRLGGHAQRAKDLLSQANEELSLAAQQANNNQNMSGPTFPSATADTAAPAAAPVDLSGTWTIYAYNTRRPGSSLKTIQITQIGSIISGNFHGPHQHGKLQGWVNGNHVEFSTDTREVLTFRGEITADGMSGLYGVNGQHAPWKAEKTK